MRRSRQIVDNHVFASDVPTLATFAPTLLRLHLYPNLCTQMRSKCARYTHLDRALYQNERLSNKDISARAGAFVYPGTNGAGIRLSILECGWAVVLVVLLVSSKAV